MSFAPRPAAVTLVDSMSSHYRVYQMLASTVSNAQRKCMSIIAVLGVMLSAVVVARQMRWSSKTKRLIIPN